MNDLYFACRTCHNYLDAGYRHCYWTLVAPGIVERNKPVDVPAILDAADYLRGADGIEFIDALEIKLFLQQHQYHDLIFAEADDFLIFPDSGSDDAIFEWLDESKATPELSPRYFFERLDMKTWAQVSEYIETDTSPPWWWEDPEYMPRAKSKFMLLTHSCGNDKTTSEMAL